MQEEATSGGFPVDHFSAGRESGVLDQTELRVEFAPADPTSRGNGFIDWAGAMASDGAMLDEMGKLSRV